MHTNKLLAVFSSTLFAVAAALVPTAASAASTSPNTSCSNPSVEFVPKSGHVGSYFQAIGRNWGAGDVVHLRLIYPANGNLLTNTTWDPVADADGNFVISATIGVGSPNGDYASRVYDLGPACKADAVATLHVGTG